MSKNTAADAERYYNVLRRIARDYQTAEQLERRAGQYGLDWPEEMAMAYENIQQEAERAIKGRRKPTSPPKAKAIRAQGDET